jgi:hypothetical protein
LDHVACLPVVGRGFKSGRDNDSVLILVENEAVHWDPFAFLITSRA